MERHTARQRRYCLSAAHQRCAIYDNISNLRAAGSVETNVAHYKTRTL